MGTLLVLLSLCIIVLFWVIAIYNNLVKNRNMVKEGWSGIDVQLKRRTNLIPNLVNTVKGYTQHEQGVLENVTEMRTQCLGTNDPAERAKSEGLLTAALGKLFAVAENYPDLKANENFIELQKSLDNIENEIQMARRYYNGAVRNLNILIESFPSNIVANIFNFKQADFFELENPSERAVPEVDFKQPV